MPTISSDYAARREMFDDIDRAVLPILRGTFPLAVVKTRVVNQGENGAPRMGVVVQLDGVPFRKAELHPNKRAKLEEIMSGLQRGIADVFPSLPVKIEFLQPPLHDRWGFVVYTTEDVPAPVYPSIIRAKAVLRPSNYLRRLLGLAAKESAA